MNPALSIAGLSVAYDTESGPMQVVRDLDLEVLPGETVGLVGESGCGKSTVAFAAVGHLPENGRLTRGSICIDGQDIASLDGEALRQIRGAGVAMIYQDPVTALNPVLRIGTQLHEALTANSAHENGKAAIVETLERVRLPTPEAILDRYPHQLSGGQLQRVVIAMALLSKPRVLLLDEPTTGLDVTVEASVVELINEIAADTDMALVYISHNLGLMARVCDQIAVMYAGVIVETGTARQVLKAPSHPYTRALIDCLPGAGGRLPTIAGQVPRPDAMPPGCSFGPRCDRFRGGLCDSGGEPAMVAASSGATVRCRRADVLAEPKPHKPAMTPVRTDERATICLSAQDISRTFGGSGLLKRLAGRASETVRAADQVSFTIAEGETVALVGESGSGKSTLARILVGLDSADAGSAAFGAHDIANLPAAKRPGSLIGAIQIIFQNPDSTLNPTHSVGRILGRAVRRLGNGQHKEDGAQARVRDLLSMVRLPDYIANRKPHELSGGQKQRVAIARAFAGDPELVIADEPVSALDVSVQASIVNLLTDTLEGAGTAVLFISHDLTLVRHIAKRVVVLYAGQVMEEGTTADVFSAPMHPYTEALLSAVHPPDPDFQPTVLATPESAEPSPENGCPFAQRCHRHIGAVCRDQPPPRRRRGDHIIACHHSLEELERLQSQMEIAHAP